MTELDFDVDDNGVSEDFRLESDMDLYQREALALSVKDPLAQTLSHMCLGLGEEAGEVLAEAICLSVAASKVLGEMKKSERDDGSVPTEERRQKFKKELGDTLWYVATAAHKAGFRLQEVADSNIEKLVERNRRGQQRGSGSDR